MNVPFLNLKAQYDTIKGEVDAAINEVLTRSSFSGGPFVERFEAEFANYNNCEFAVGVGSGTEALWLGLLALGVTIGDEVITTPNTFIATVEAISLCGAKAVFIDVDDGSLTMDPSLLEGAITSRTKAIIPVHLYGQTADMDPIIEIGRKYGVAILEDACQAHGSKYKEKHAGSIGDIGCFSFYPGKNLGAYGEAGCVITNERNLAAKIRAIRDHGQSQKYYHEVLGINGRMDGIQGAILSVKLKYLDQWNSLRRNWAHFYNEMLHANKNISLPLEMPYAHHVYHIYAIRCSHRDYLISALAEQGITCGVHYPVPIHMQRAYDRPNEGNRTFSIAERSAKELLSLPMFPELTEEQVVYVCTEIMRVLENTGS